jgi:hypothetical protein
MNYFTYFPPAPELADQIAFYGIHDRPENIPETYLSPPLGFCGFMFYLYIAAGYETKIGAMTAYIDNLIISALYVILILKPQTDVNLLSAHRTFMPERICFKYFVCLCLCWIACIFTGLQCAGVQGSQ